MLSFSLLGHVVVSKDGETLNQFRSQKELALLIYLAHTQRSHAREAVAELLWEGRTKRQALTNLRTALARLRKQVGDELQVTRKTVALAPANLQQVDSARLLETLMEIGAVTSAEKATTLQSALTTYQGDFLDNFELADAPQFEEWVTTTHANIQLQLNRAYKKLGEYALSTERTTDGIDIARRWLGLDPLNETAHMLLMRAYIANGDTHAAHAHYEQVVTLLQRELGIAPSAEMTTLVAQNRPSRIERLLIPTRHNLPADYDQFIGRKAAQNAIHTRLDQPYCRLVTIVGQGGAGKTRLSKQIARHRLDRYPDGVWLIELAEIDPTDPDLPEAIAIEIATSLELRLSGTATPIDQLLDFLQHKQMLLVLDNFEHLLNGTPIVLDILKRCERVQMLVTSRELLGLRAEWVVDLAGLSHSDNVTDSQPSDAVALFVARQAQQQRAGILVADHTAIRTICRIVGGLPLAIELAAALTRTMSCQAIADTLHNGFGTLKSSLRDVPARHQNLRVVFEMSWQTLTPDLQLCLSRLAVFRGGFTEDAARQIADAETRHFIALREKSLLAYDIETDRYALHPVVRSYAAKKRSADDPTRHNHAVYYLTLLAQHTDPLQKQTPNHSVDALKPDIDNIRLAWRTGLAEKEAGLLLSALTSLSLYHQLRGLSHEGEAIMHRTRKHADKWGQNGWRLATHAGLERARFQNRLGRARLAIQTLKKAVQIAVQGADRWAEGMGYVWWGESLWRLGEYDAAIEKLNDARKIADEIDSTLMRGWSHHQLGIVNDIQSRFADAHAHLAQACVAWRELDNILTLSVSLNSIGLVYGNQGDLLAAKRTLEHSLLLCNQIDYLHLKSILLNNLSINALNRGNYVQAQQYLQRSLSMAVVGGNLTGQGNTFINLGISYRYLGEVDLAIENIERGLQIAQTIGHPPMKAASLVNLAHVRREQNVRSSAETLYQQALEIAQQNDLSMVVCEVFMGMAQLAEETNQEQAKQYSQAAVALATKIGSSHLLERATTIALRLSTHSNKKNLST